MPSDGAPAPPEHETKGDPNGRYMADSFSDSGMRDTASATRADVGSDALQKGKLVNGARVHVSGTPTHDARRMSRAHERARRKGRGMARRRVCALSARVARCFVCFGQVSGLVLSSAAAALAREPVDQLATVATTRSVGRSRQSRPEMQRW